MMRTSLRAKLILMLLGILAIAVGAWAWQAARLTDGLYRLIEHTQQAEHQRLLFAELRRKQANAELFALMVDQAGQSFVPQSFEPLLLDRQILWVGEQWPDGHWQQWPEPYSAQALKALLGRHAQEAMAWQLPHIHCIGETCGLLYHFQMPCEGGAHGCTLYMLQALDVLLADFYALTNSDILIRIDTGHRVRVLGTHMATYKALVASLQQGRMTLASGNSRVVHSAVPDATWLVQRMAVPPAWQGIDIYVISDVHTLVRFFTQLRWEVLAGLLGLGLLIFAALYVGLNRTVSQLEMVERAMGAVAKNRFDAAIKLLKGLKRSRFHDELDALVDETLLATEAQQRLHAELSYIAYHDELTGLKNRHAFMEALNNLLAQPGLLIMTDLDRFKQINDLYGHAAGDLALKTIARRLQQFVEQWPGSAPYRLAGDEFVIWMPLSQGEAVEPRLDALKQIMDGAFTGPEGERIYLEGSLGAVRVPEHAREPEAALRKADKALYIAKQEDNVRGWHLFDPLHDEDTEATLQEHAILDHVRDALARDAFRLVYQPILNIHAQRISHYEVLLRLDDAKGQPISPAVFIPIAERHGLSARIDEWVFRQVVLKLQHTPEEVHLAVNFSAATVQRRDLAAWVLGQLQEKGVAPERLLVELTETAYVTNVRQARENLAALQAAGVRVALDDFGVGHASFNYLTQLPLDLVKLDGSYVRDMVENRRHQALVKGITEIVHAWGLQVVAEYVEDGRILSLLAAAGVDFAQGYQIGKPATDVAGDDPQQLSS